MQHLPERDRPPIKARLRRAWRETDYERALEQLTRLADELDHTHPGAAGSLREGMDETLTVIKLGIRGKLRRTLESTNPAESMIGLGYHATITPPVVIGYTDLPRLAVAIERRLHLHQPNPITTEEAAIAVTV